MNEAGTPERPQLGVREAEPCRRLRGELGDRARMAEDVRRLQIDEIRDRRQRSRRTALPKSTTASAGSASITSRHVPAASSPPRISSACVHKSAASLGSNCCRCASVERLRRLDPFDPVRDFDELGELREPATGSGPRLASARQASPVHPIARTQSRGQRHSVGQPELLGECLRELRVVAIMPSTSRRPEIVNSSPTRNGAAGVAGAERAHHGRHWRRLPGWRSYLPDFSAMSSPNHFACSWASGGSRH